MSKRKGNIPQKVDEEKRKCLSWNMMDGVEDPQGSSAIFCDGQSEILPQHSFEDGLPDIAQEITLGNEEICVKDSFSYTEHLFYFHLDYCSFFVSIMDRLHTKDGNWSCEIGRFELQVESEPSCFSLMEGLLPQCEECWLYVADPGHRNMLYFELDDNDENLNSNGLAKRNTKYPQFWFASVSLPTVCLKALQVKAYQMVRGKFDPASKVLEVIICAKETVLMKPQFPSENIRPNKITRATTVLMGHFYGFEPDFNFDGLSRTEKYDFDKLFEGVKKCHIERIKSLCVDVQHPCLKPVLRQYQRQAVTWMLSQERYHDGTTHTPAHTGPALHFLYAEVTMKDGKVLYYNKHNGVLVMKQPLMSSWPPGGLLADEMGLGKTVEVLSCVLLHPRTSLPRPQKLSFSCDQEEITTLEHSKIGLHNFSTDPLSVGCHQDNQNTELTLVTMSDNPTSVGCHQDNQNTELTSVTMSDNPTSVGSHQDNQNTELTSVTMSDNPTSVGSHQDNQNTELTLVTMSDNPTSVGSHQYNQNTELTSVTMSDNPTSVGSHQDNQNTELTSVTMSDNPTSVGSHQDNQNTELTSVTMSDNPPSVGGHQYNQNTELTSVTMSDNPTSVGSHQYNQNTELTSVTMSDNPTSVGSHQYNQNTELTSVTMSDNPPSVGSHQDNQNTELTSVTMSDNPTSVGSHQYNQNTELTSVTMSDNPTSVGSHQYNQNTELASVTMSDNPPSVGSHQYNQNTELMSGISSGCMKAMDENAKPKVLVLSTHICEVSEHEKGSNSSIHNSKSMSNEDVICDMNCHDSGALSSNESDVQSIGLPGQPTADKVLRRRKNKRLTFGKKKRMMITADVARKTKALNKSGKSEKNMKFHILVEENGFKPATFFINTHISQKQWFECVCGGDANDRRSKKKKLTNVQCVVCGLWQHAQCLHYDLNNAYRGCYKCPHCHVSSSPIPSGATLIISPFSICHQWKEEIKKHVRQETLRVFVYTGVSKQGFIQPQTLADCDVVITTYETLRKEIDYVDLPHSNSSAGRRFRHRKRFMAIPSPIIAVEWWRICLDEAQMVECTTTKTAEMALRLSGVNRWCVTGTPIQKSVQDLYGLLLFLGMDPYWVQLWWNRLLYQPFSYGITQPMYDTLSQALWRTAKRDVLDQIQLPPQSQAVHWLTFSPVEDHFYRRQYRDCAKEAAQKLCKWTDSSVKLSSMDRHTMSQLMQPLLRLRQACCHPQAVRGEFLPIHKNTMTMEELLESLTRKAKLESEEAHRQFIAALNGLAALCIIKEEYSEAVLNYRCVLRSVTEHEGRLKTDDLQQLHALHNLHEILMIKPANVHPTLRDHQLHEQANDLRTKYMLKAENKVATAQEALGTAQCSVKDTSDEYGREGEWWAQLLELMVQRELGGDLVLKVRDDIEGHANPGVGISMASSFRNIQGLEYCIYTQLSAMKSAREKLVKAVKKIRGKPTMDAVSETVGCCLRPAKETLRICPFCKTDELFNAYEAKIFSFRERGIVSINEGQEMVHQVNTKRQGTWADSDVEKTLKSILNFCRHHGVPHHQKNLLDAGAAHIRHLEALKKEFKPLRAVWLAAREQVSAVDELDMATTRLRVRLQDEPQSEIPQPNVIERGQVAVHRMHLVGDKANAEVELRKKLGQLLYLTNLAKSQEGKDGNGSNPDPCPICQKALGVEWSVLLCGHCYCLDCIRIMVEQYSFGGRNRSLKCALCRQATHHSDISYVSTKKSAEEEEEDTIVIGSHSTKVKAVVSCIKKVCKEDPKAKALIFSTVCQKRSTEQLRTSLRNPHH